MLITVMVVDLMLLLWYLFRPVRIAEVMFVQAAGGYAMLVSVPERRRDGSLMICSTVPDDLTDVLMAGCVIKIPERGKTRVRVLDVTFEQPMKIMGDIRVFLDPQGNGMISISSGPQVSF